MSGGLSQVKVYYDQVGNTLTVWFGNPQDEYICEETGDEVVLMKDRSGRVIGFERLNFHHWLGRRPARAGRNFTFDVSRLTFHV